MKPKDKSINSFGTFLDTIKGPQAKASPVQAPTQASTPLLDALAGDTPRTVADLMQETGMGVLAFGKTLKAAQDAGLVELQTSAAGEEVRLTEIGRQLVGVTRNR